jgi:glycoside/pentoside/hexuronide:cation symporter, GPH family
MGVVLATGFLVSAVIDLIVGFGLEQRLTTARSASRLQLGGAMFCSASLIAVFLGAWVPVEARFGYALAAGIVFRLGFATYDIPQNALMALATIDRASRLRMASTRIWFSGTATLLVATTVGPLIASRGLHDAVPFLLGLSVLFAIAAISSAWLLARLMGGLQAAPAPRPGIRSAHRPLPADFRLLLLVMVATSIFTPAFGKLEPYFAAYTLRSAWWGSGVIVLMATGIVIGQPVWARLCARLSSGLVMLFNALLQMTALAAFWQIGPAHPAASAAAAFLFGLGNGGVGMVQWAAFSETVARLGPGRTGLSYGLFAATSKISLAAGGALLAAVLDRIDFRSPGSADLAVAMAVIPGIGALLCAVAGIGLILLERAEGRTAASRGIDL